MTLKKLLKVIPDGITVYASIRYCNPLDQSHEPTLSELRRKVISVMPNADYKDNVIRPYIDVVLGDYVDNGYPD